MSIQNGDTQKVRVVSVSPADMEIIKAFEIALAQCGVRFIVRRMPYVTIIGNKSDGEVVVETINSRAVVYINWLSDAFYGVSAVCFDKLDGKQLETRLEVKLSSIGPKKVSILTAFNHYLTLRNTVLFALICTAVSPMVANSILLNTWEYPNISYNNDVIKLTYLYENECCTVSKIELWYNHIEGYTKATVNGKIYRPEKPFSPLWKKASR